jgi:hypothetical protein
MLRYQLRGLKAVHDITALEFYVSSPDYCDDANHCHPGQLLYGRWYVHTEANHQSFKAPRECGLDLTLGSSSSAIHAGMLIRQLDFDGGSGKAIMKMIRGAEAGEGNLEWSEREENLLQNLQGQDAFTARIRLEKREKPRKGEIVAKKRIGIEGTSHADELLHFSLVLQ